jgi:hypothetical protein
MMRDGPANDARPPGAAADELPERWHQHAGFSVFFDTRSGLPGKRRWRTRLRHEETADETTLSGDDPASWVRWILDKLGSAQPLSEMIDALVSMEIIDVHLAGDPKGPGDAKVELQLRVTGLDELYRTLGARVVGALFGPELE